jgi:hypothetical protein
MSTTTPRSNDVDLMTLIDDKLLNGQLHGLADWEFRQLYYHLFSSRCDAEKRTKTIDALVERGHRALAAALLLADTTTVMDAWMTFTATRTANSAPPCAKGRVLDTFVGFFADDERRLPAGFTWEATPEELATLRRGLAALPIDDQCEVLIRMIRRVGREQDLGTADVMMRAVQSLITNDHRHFIAGLVYDRPRQNAFVDRFPAWVKDLGRWLVWQEILHLWQPPGASTHEETRLS